MHFNLAQKTYFRRLITATARVRLLISVSEGIVIWPPKGNNSSRLARDSTGVRSEPIQVVSATADVYGSHLKPLALDSTGADTYRRNPAAIELMEEANTYAKFRGKVQDSPTGERAKRLHTLRQE